MSAKNRDNKNRWRNITVGFRVSPEENELINKAVALSGLPKQTTFSSLFRLVSWEKDWMNSLQGLWQSIRTRN